MWHKKMGQDQWFRIKAVNSKRALEFTFYEVPGVWPWYKDEDVQKPCRSVANT